MKLSEIKHDHSLTDLLKIFIFSILMLLPFLSVLTRCMYVTFNKNAYRSYYGETINEKQNILINYEDLKTNTNYIFNNNIIENNETANTYSNFIYITNLQPNTMLNFNVEEANELRLRFASDHKPYAQFFNNGTLLQSFILSSTVLNIQFEITEFTLNSTIEYFNYFYEETYNKYSYMDNVFEYSFQRMSQDDMFNWTQNTALYNGIHAMTTNLQIQTNVIAILLTYWTILTIVYVIIDIVLKCFTLLTHGFSRKTS